MYVWICVCVCVNVLQAQIRKERECICISIPCFLWYHKGTKERFSAFPTNVIDAPPYGLK